MTANAAVVSVKLVELFDTIPDYVDYDSSDVVRDLESDYRVALGRVAKEWGDQLLDLAENPPTPLTRNESRTIDALLERISEIFQELNTFRDTRLPINDEDRRLQLRRSDSAILRCIEQNAILMHGLQPHDGGSLWLHGHANAMYRRLRRLVRELHRRNKVLCGVGGLQVSHDVGDEGDRSGGGA